jgi:tetratricopeptide (TPR) repeat protein
MFFNDWSTDGNRFIRITISYCAMPQAKELLEEGKKRLAKGDWKGASQVFGEAVDMLEDQAASPEERTILAELLRRKGHADARIGELQDAMAQVKEALEISETLEDNFGEADALRGLGYIYWQKGDVPMALEFYDLALDKASACASQELVGRIKIEIANAYNTKGDRAKAKETYQQAISILKSVGSMNELARAYNNLGSCYLDNNELDEALDALRQCMDIATKIGDTTIKGWAAFNAAECFTQMGETKFAKEYLGMALEFLTLSDDRIGIASTLKVMGVTYCAERDWPLAEETFNKSLAIIKDIEMPGLEGDILISVAKMWLARGQKEKTVEVLKTAIALLEEGNRKKNADEARKILATL